jgi:putative membrane protein insertion efficiency factor
MDIRHYLYRSYLNAILDHMLLIHKHRLLKKSWHGCIFLPTCSEYTVEAVRTYGIMRGVTMGIKRILRCREGSKGGWDPIPGGRDGKP